MPSSKVKNILIPVSCLFRGSIQHVLKLVSHSTEGVQIGHCGIKIILSWRHLRIVVFFFFLNPLIFLKAEPSKRSQLLKLAVMNPLPRVTLILSLWRQQLTPHSDIIITIISSGSPPRGPFTLPKSHLFSYKSPFSLCLSSSNWCI